MNPSNNTSDRKVAYLSFIQQMSGKIAPCERSVRQFKSATAHTYEQVAENLPRMIETIDAENERTRKHVQYLLLEDESETEASEVRQALKETRKNVVMIATSFRAMLNLDEETFKKIQSQVDGLENLQVSISEITAISDDIELLSYNSVFVASQAGLHGAAFTHVAKEIKILSNKTNSIVVRMRDSSDALVANYDSFSQGVEKINSETNNRLGAIDSELTRIFDKCNTGLKNVAMLTLQLIERSEQSKNCVQDIMISLQSQDLAWQLLDQVSFLDDHIANRLHGELLVGLAHSKGDETTQIIEESSARAIASIHMANRIVGMVRENMTASTDNLAGLLRKLIDELADIKADLDSIVNFFVCAQPSLEGRSSIQMFFDDSTEFMEDIRDFIRSSIAKKHEIGEYSVALRTQLRQIKLEFKEMHDFVRQFSMIKVISKMEVTREPALSDNMTGSTEMFERLTERMETSVKSLGAQIETIHKGMGSNLDQLNENLIQQEQSIDHVERTVESAVSRLRTVSRNSQEAVRQIGQGSGNLGHLIDESLNGIRVIREHIANSVSISEQLEALVDGIEAYRKKNCVGDAVFSKDVSHARFPDLVALSNKFNVYDEPGGAQLATEGQDLSEDLVLF